MYVITKGPSSSLAPIFRQMFRSNIDDLHNLGEDERSREEKAERETERERIGAECGREERGEEEAERGRRERERGKRREWKGRERERKAETREE